MPISEHKIAHLRAYGCRAYTLNYHFGQYDRLEPRVHIRSLVGYESTNIYRTWVPHLSRVVSARDVTFDGTKRYQPVNAFEQVTGELVRPLKIKSLEGIEDEANAELPNRIPDLGANTLTAERSLDEPNDTIIVDSGAVIDEPSSIQVLCHLSRPPRISLPQIFLLEPFLLEDDRFE